MMPRFSRGVWTIRDREDGERFCDRAGNQGVMDFADGDEEQHSDKYGRGRPMAALTSREMIISGALLLPAVKLLNKGSRPLKFPP